MRNTPYRSPLPPESLEGGFLLSPGNRDFLTGASPRLVDSPGPAGILAFGSIWSLVSVLFVLVLPLGREWLMKARLARDGIETRGTVLALGRKHHRSDHSDRSEHATYSIRYVFRAGPGGVERYAAEHQIDRDAYRSLRVGEEVAVTYWRAHPSWSRSEGAALQGAGLMYLTAIFMCLVTYGLVGLCRSIHDIRDGRRLAREGRIVNGVVLSAKGKSDGDGNLVMKLWYRLEPEGMAPIEGKTTATRNDLKEAGPPAPGTPLLALWIPPRKHRVL